MDYKVFVDNVFHELQDYENKMYQSQYCSVNPNLFTVKRSFYMGKLSKLPNIGKIVEEQLLEVKADLKDFFQKHKK